MFAIWILDFLRLFVYYLLTTTTTLLSLKSLCTGGVPSSSHPSLALSVFFRSLFFYEGVCLKILLFFFETGVHWH